MSLPGNRTVWEEGHEPGRDVVALGVALALTTACLDLTITGRVGLVFDLGFVVLCAGLALAVRQHDFFAVGVLPPLLMLGTFALLAVSRAQAIAARRDAPVDAVLSGLTHHAPALLIGYALALAILAQRHRVAHQRELSSLR